MLLPRWRHSTLFTLPLAATYILSCRGADAECFACLDTFVVYVQGDRDWLEDGYALEVIADGQSHRCDTGGMEEVGEPSITCGDTEDAPRVKLMGGDGQPAVVRISFWRVTPERITITLRDGEDEALVEHTYEPKYEEVDSSATCPVCTRAESETLRVSP